MNLPHPSHLYCGTFHVSDRSKFHFSVVKTVVGKRKSKWITLILYQWIIFGKLEILFLPWINSHIVFSIVLRHLVFVFINRWAYGNPQVGLASPQTCFYGHRIVWTLCQKIPNSHSKSPRSVLLLSLLWKCSKLPSFLAVPGNARLHDEAESDPWTREVFESVGTSRATASLPGQPPPSPVSLICESGDHCTDLPNEVPSQPHRPP